MRTAEHNKIIDLTFLEHCEFRLVSLCHRVGLPFASSMLTDFEGVRRSAHQGDTVRSESKVEIDRWENEGGRVVFQVAAKHLVPVEWRTTSESPCLTGPSDENEA